MNFSRTSSSLPVAALLTAIFAVEWSAGYQCYLDNVGVKENELYTRDQFKVFPCGPNKVCTPKISGLSNNDFFDIV